MEFHRCGCRWCCWLCCWCAGGCQEDTGGGRWLKAGGNVCAADRRRGQEVDERASFLLPVFGEGKAGRLVPGDGGKAWVGSFMHVLLRECVACERAAAAACHEMSGCLPPIADLSPMASMMMPVVLWIVIASPVPPCCVPSALCTCVMCVCSRSAVNSEPQRLTFPSPCIQTTQEARGNEGDWAIDPPSSTAALTTRASTSRTA